MQVSFKDLRKITSVSFTLAQLVNPPLPVVCADLVNVVPQVLEQLARLGFAFRVIAR